MKVQADAKPALPIIRGKTWEPSLEMDHLFTEESSAQPLKRGLRLRRRILKRAPLDTDFEWHILNALEYGVVIELQTAFEVILGDAFQKTLDKLTRRLAGSSKHNPILFDETLFQNSIMRPVLNVIKQNGINSFIVVDLRSLEHIASLYEVILSTMPDKDKRTSEMRKSTQQRALSDWARAKSLFKCRYGQASKEFPIFVANILSSEPLYSEIILRLRYVRNDSDPVESFLRILRSFEKKRSKANQGNRTGE